MPKLRADPGARPADLSAGDSGGPVMAGMGGADPEPVLKQVPTPLIQSVLLCCI